MAGDERDSDKPFKVQDRRRFSASGDARPDVADAAEAPAAAAGGTTADASAGDAATHAHDHAHQPHEQGHAHEPVELNFATFLISLSTQALALLGEIPDPVSGQTRVDLAGARQFIDIIAILGEKTRGNLDPHENALLQNALYDLRMKFVERSSGR
jgi:hypothetical protein